MTPEEALTWCERFVAARPSNVTRLSVMLSPERRPLFFPTYAAMRVIDDEVDDDFLARDDAGRGAGRAAMLERIELWRCHAQAAVAGRYAGGAKGEDDTIFTAMNATIGRGDMGPAPFDGLADAMARDAREERLATWADFLAYTEGAAVAPAAVFAYIVACRMAPDGGSSCAVARPLADYVRHLAIFSYLVHILRDLRKDARRAPQHLTLPDDLLAGVGMDKAALQAAALAADDRALAPLAETVAELALGHRRRALEDLAALSAETEGRAQMLIGLAEVYRRQLDGIRGDFRGVLDGAGVVDMATVDRLLAQAG